MTEARAMVGVQIESFAANTLEFLRREHELLTHGIPAPDMDTDMNGRHVLVVVRGYHYREDLAALRPYIREYKPVMVAVDGGADALIEAGYQPDAIFGDMDSVSDEALCCGAELVVHAYPDGRAPGLARVRELGLDAITIPAPGTSEDVALLVADAKGATLIAWWARTTRWRSSSTRAGRGCRVRSSRTFGSRGSWSTPGACTSCTTAGSPAGRCSCWCSPRR